MYPKGQTYFYGAVIYTVGIIVVKLMGAFYKIPLGNLLGDDGYNHFIIAYKIYNVFLTVSTAGIPVAMSRLISESNTLGCEQQVCRIFRVGLWTFVVIGSVGSVIMLLFSTELANIMGDIRASYCIFVMAPSVLFVCVTAAYRGYAQGHADMIPTTVSQIVETATKVVVGLAVAYALNSLGKSIEICAAGAIFGTTISSLVAMLYLIKNRRKYQAEGPATSLDSTAIFQRRVFKELLHIGWPITISSSVMSLIQLADSVIILNLLQQRLGYTEIAAYVLNGAYEKAATVYNLPSAFVVPFMASVVPAVTSARISKNQNEACVVAENTMRMCTIICLPMAVGMTVLAEPCMSVLFPSVARQGNLLLCELGIASYFMTMSLITNSILSANGNERLPLISIFLGGVTKVVITYVLVGNPTINIYGAPIGTFCCYIVMLTSNLFFISKRMIRAMDLGRILGKAGISAVIMGVAARTTWIILYETMKEVSAMLANRPLNVLVPFVAAVIMGAMIYIVLIIAFRAITVEDMKLFPKGECIARKLHMY